MKNFIYLLTMLIILNTTLFAKNNQADCIILEDENSIICKYIQTRVSYDKNITFHWIEPDGKITRTKDLVIPAGHGSIYDYRYIRGRTFGTWTFEVIDGTNKYSTNFTIK